MATGVSSNGALTGTGTAAFSNAITLGSAATIGASSGTLTFSGNIANGVNLLTFAGAGNLTQAGSSVIGNGSGGLTMSGTGTLSLANANTYTGATTINNGGIIKASNNAALGTALVTVASGGELLLNGVTLANNLNLNGAGVGTQGAIATTGGTANVFKWWHHFSRCNNTRHYQQ